jgi:hypothetical protein
MKTIYQVIRYDAHAFSCHYQVRHLGYFDTKEDAEAFAGNAPDYGAKIIVRTSDCKY